MPAAVVPRLDAGAVEVRERRRPVLAGVTRLAQVGAAPALVATAGSPRRVRPRSPEGVHAIADTQAAAVAPYTTVGAGRRETRLAGLAALAAPAKAIDHIPDGPARGLHAPVLAGQGPRPDGLVGAPVFVKTWAGKTLLDDARPIGQAPEGDVDTTDVP